MNVCLHLFDIYGTYEPITHQSDISLIFSWCIVKWKSNRNSRSNGKSCKNCYKYQQRCDKVLDRQKNWPIITMLAINHAHT